MPGSLGIRVRGTVHGDGGPLPPEGGDTVLSLALTVQASGVRVAERGVADAPLRSSRRQGLSPTPEATSSARRLGAVGVQRGAHPSRSPRGAPWHLGAGVRRASGLGSEVRGRTHLAPSFWLPSGMLLVMLMFSLTLLPLV